MLLKGLGYLHFISAALELALITITIILLSSDAPIGPSSQFPTETVRIYGRSLEPVIKAGSRVNVRLNLRPNQYHRGDYIVFVGSGGRHLAKRLVAKSGDRLRIEADHLFVNEKPVRNSVGERYVLTSRALRAAIELKPEVDPGTLFVLGERARGTLDSSAFFVIPQSAVFGKILNLGIKGVAQTIAE